MKRINRLILFAALLAVFSCGQDGGGGHQAEETPEGQTEKATSALLGDTADAYRELVTENEQPNRIIWQKPDLVLSKLGPFDGKVVADIGAGTGYFSFRLARKGARVIAVDIDPNAIEWMHLQRERASREVQENLDIRRAEYADPNLRPGEADIVLMVNTYIYLQDRVAYLRNLKKGMKPGARVVLIDFKKKSTTVGPPVEERLSLLDVERDLREAGYQILESDDRSLDYQYIITAILSD
jgi:SAM-dependent methyltransferase